VPSRARSKSQDQEIKSFPVLLIFCQPARQFALVA